jgi:hypothetical protein
MKTIMSNLFSVDEVEVAIALIAMDPAKREKLIELARGSAHETTSHDGITASMGNTVTSGGEATAVKLKRSGKPSRKASGPKPVRTPKPKAEKADGEGGKRRRASPEEVSALKTLAMNIATTLTPGFAKGDVNAKGGVDSLGERLDFGRTLSLLVEDGKLIRKGERRNARYWVKA